MGSAFLSAGGFRQLSAPEFTAPTNNRARQTNTQRPTSSRRSLAQGAERQQMEHIMGRTARHAALTIAAATAVMVAVAGVDGATRPPAQGGKLAVLRAAAVKVDITPE